MEKERKKHSKAFEDFVKSHGVDVSNIEKEYEENDKKIEKLERLLYAARNME